MYFRVTKKFLSERSRVEILAISNYNDLTIIEDKQTLVNIVFDRWHFTSMHPEVDAYYKICEHCRKCYRIQVLPNEEPTYCISCKKTTPLKSFKSNLTRVVELKNLAQSYSETNHYLINILLEQSLVSLIGYFEILMRETYSLTVDFDHVVIGRSIYPKIYNETRNQFLNLGVANAKLKKETAINIKNLIGDDSFRFFSKMYSVRHTIVHNASIKDSDYISQTGENSDELGKKIHLEVNDIERLITMISCLLDSFDKVLQDVLLKYNFELCNITFKRMF